MPRIELDHIVVAAASLDEGIAWVGERLGVTVPRGGQHAAMGTHNAVGRLSGPGPDVYLEIIAVDPDAQAPERPRWFSLSDPDVLESLVEDGPRLAHWLVRSDDIDTTLEGHEERYGRPLPMSRGDLNWRISVRNDGRLLDDGVVPTVLEWPAGTTHPCRGMVDLGARLDGLTLVHPEPDALRRDLVALGADGLDGVRLVAGDTPRLAAELTTARGTVIF